MTHLSQTRYTPLVEVNQAIKAWSLLEVLASLVTVPQRVLADFLSSSFISMNLLVRADTSLSTFLTIFSDSSRDSVALVSLLLVSS